MNSHHIHRRNVRIFVTGLIIVLMVLLISISAMYTWFSGALEEATYLTPGERRSAWAMQTVMILAGPVVLFLAAVAVWSFMKTRHATPEEPQTTPPDAIAWAPAPGEQFVELRRINRMQVVLTVLVVLIALGCVLGTISTWETGLTDGWATHRRRGLLLGLMVGPMMIAVVAAVLGWVNPWIFSKKGPAVVVGASGLFVNVAGCSVGQVSWDEIRSTSVQKVNNVRYLAVEVNDPEDVVDRSASPVVAMNHSAYGTPVFFQLSRVRGWRRQLGPALQRFGPLRQENELEFSR